MEKFFIFMSKIIGFFCMHRWAYTERVNLGCGVFAKFTCQICRKTAYVPYSGGDKYNSNETGLS